MNNNMNTCERCLESIINDPYWRLCADCRRQEIIEVNQKHLRYCNKFLDRLNTSHPEDVDLIKDVKEEIKDTFDYIRRLQAGE